MKKFIFSFTLLAILFAFSFERGEATCPTGYTEYSGVITNVYGCDFYVKVCYKCGITYPGDVLLNGYTKVDQTCITTTTNEADIMNEISNKITNPNFIFAYLCPNTITPPCDQYDSGLFYTITVNRCWEKIWIDNKLWTVPCDTGDDLCYTLVKFCYNYQTKQYEKKIVHDPVISTYYTCPSGFPTNPPNPGTSPCFHLNTICDQ